MRTRVNWESTTIGDASLAKRYCQEKSQKVHSGGFPRLCYLISADLGQPDLTVASGIRTRRWLSHQTIGKVWASCVCQTLNRLTASDFVREPLLITVVGHHMGLFGREGEFGGRCHGSGYGGVTGLGKEVSRVCLSTELSGSATSSGTYRDRGIHRPRLEMASAHGWSDRSRYESHE